MSHAFRFALLIVLACSSAVSAQFTTHAESTDYVETPRYDETIEYIRTLAANSSWIHLESFGTTPEGRTMWSVIVSSEEAFTPAAAAATGHVKVLIQNGIHSGEIDGKDASLALIRDMAVLKTRRALLDHVMLIIVPVFNIDGHEMMSKYNRINQDGPIEMGFRATGQNLNLNRDYLKVDTPEMAALVQLWNRWEPDLLIDNHVTDGADFQYATTYTISRHDSAPPSVRDWSRKIFVPVVTQKMKDMNEPIFPYVATGGRPLHEGITDFVETPRYSTGYAPIRNRPGLLVEMHMLKNYKRRVTANYKMMVAVLEMLNEAPDALKQANKTADSMDIAGAFDHIPLRFERVDEPDTVDFLGYPYETRVSEISGGEWIVYDTTKKVTLRLPYYGQMRATLKISTPFAYLIPQQWTETIDKLALHGVHMNRLTAGVELDVETYLFDSVSFAERPFEGRHLVNYVTSSEMRRVAYPEGTYVVFLTQPGMRLIMHALEPDAPDSFFKWGFFNTILERKEYGERYASEALGVDMLANDPAVKAEFEQRIQQDSSFAADPTARWNFFYHRSKWSEPMLNVYPVGRLLQKTDLPLK